MVSQQTTFSRTLINDSKLGAYYTDKEHCRRMGRMVRFLSEATVLEPSMGDASALESFLSTCEKVDGKKIYTYGVEMQKDAYEIGKERVTYSLWADFLYGTKLQSKAFGVCFTNPPYGEGEDRADRLEKQFIEAIYPAMVAEGLLVAVLPYQLFKLHLSLRSLFERFSFAKEDIFRFDDSEYAKYHQLVVFARRRVRQGYSAESYAEIKKLFEADEPDFPYLPKEDDEVPRVYDVAEAKDEKVEVFAPVSFDEKAAADGLAGSPLYRKLRLMTKPGLFHGLRIGNPPAPLKKDLLYLTAIAGGGQGKAGSVEEGTFHLQRGTVKAVTEEIPITDEKGDVIGVEEKTHSQISMNIIEPSGKVSSLIGEEGGKNN